MAWSEFVAAFLVFFLCHSLPVREPVRGRLVALLGERGFSWLYSLVSIAVLYWVLMAAGRAPYIELWERKNWQSHVTVVAMVIAVEILALSINKPNPFSFGGSRSRAFNPRRAGLVQWMRHPVLVAGFVWAVAHILPNGDLAHVIMFSIFAIFSVVGVRMIDRRKQREMGILKWQVLQDEVKRNRWDLLGMNPQSALNRLMIGMVCYVMLVWSHDFLFGNLDLG